MLAENMFRWEEDLREEGRQKGREEGREEGRREGREEGRQEGRQEGAQETILNVLQRRFGTFPVALASALSQVRSSQELTDLTIFASTAPSLEAFQDRLNLTLQF